MHELAITENILKIALDEVKTAQASKITKVNLVIGELSGVVGDCVQFYFDFLSKDSVAEKATLDFKTVPAQLRCRDCRTEFNPRDSVWLCPNCQSASVEIIAGRDCYIESIEVE